MFYIKSFFAFDELDVVNAFFRREVGHILTTDDDGCVILITHGSPDGEITCTLSFLEMFFVDKVYCCYPAAVQSRYPELPVQGDWNTRTRFTIMGGEKPGYYARQAP